MDERTRMMIDAYIPSPRDMELEDGEYYYLQATASGERVIKVMPLDVLFAGDHTEYRLYRQQGARVLWVDANGDGDFNRGVRKAALYDNKDDCRNQTHVLYDGWEELREIQEGENG